MDSVDVSRTHHLDWSDEDTPGEHALLDRAAVGELQLRRSVAAIRTTVSSVWKRHLARDGDDARTRGPARTAWDCGRNGQLDHPFPTVTPRPVQCDVSFYGDQTAVVNTGPHWRSCPSQPRLQRDPNHRHHHHTGGQHSCCFTSSHIHHPGSAHTIAMHKRGCRGPHGSRCRIRAQRQKCRSAARWPPVTRRSGAPSGIGRRWTSAHGENYLRCVIEVTPWRWGRTNQSTLWNDIGLGTVDRKRQSG